METKTLHKTKILLQISFFISIFLFLSGLCFNLQANAKPVYSDIKNIYVRLTYNNTVWEYRFPEIEYKSGIDNAINNNFKKDYRGRILEQKDSFSCSYKLKKAEEKLKIIAKYIDTEPIKAEISFNPNSKKMFNIKDDIKGNRLNIEKHIKLINQNLSKGKSVDITIVPDKINAEVTTQSLKKATNIRSEFSTDFTYSIPERKHNIRLSLKQINGLVIKPDQSFSFNEIVGPRTKEKGYKTSKIISNGDFVEGVGGGVCQTSTTLYNALILSDVKILEQHRHTLLVSYIPPSFDAMVNINTSDLKFKNNTGNFLFIKTWTDENRAYVRIYGQKMDYIIKRKSTIIKEYQTPKEELIIDKEGKYKDLYEGERRIILHSKPKRETKGELLYYKQGKLIKTVMLRKDVYLQLIGKEVVGTAKKPPQMQ